MIRKFFAFLITFGLLVGFASCSEQELEPAKSNGEVLLKLRIYAGLDNASASDNPSSRSIPMSRSKNDHRPDGYESSDGDAEKIRTMRVIILRYDTINEQIIRTVEAARVVRTSDAGVPINDNLEFPVLPNDNKTIVLIANETSIPVSPNRALTASQWLDRWFSAQRDDQGRDRQVSESTWNALMNWTISMSPDQPSFFTVLGDDGNYYQNPIPLSETFEIRTVSSDHKVEDGGEQDARIIQSSNLFITRAAAKVTYKIFCDESYATDGQTSVVTGIRLDSIQPTEYLFIKNGRYYLPKYNLVPGTTTSETDWRLGINEQNWSSKRITGFEAYSLEQYFNLPTMLTGDNAIPIKEYSDADAPVVGPIYFPESMVPTPTSYFRVSVQINGGEWLSSQPLVTNILNSENETGGRDAISRNTHLYVNIYFGAPGITAEVNVVPYVGVDLKPTFGFLPENTAQ
ncbi:MAG: hypothetical protein K2M25_01430 [Muribaculaceae bacterium]|nr:hypothetical protein [Muribaculaceae bacterium]